VSAERVEELYRLFGTEDLAEMIESIEGERQGMRELHDENTALKIYNRRLRLVVEMAARVFDLLGDVAMFMPGDTRALIEKAREQIAQVQRTVAESKAIVER